MRPHLHFPRYAYRARLNRAVCLEKLGRFTDALSELDMIQRQFPSFPDAAAASAVLLLHVARPLDALAAVHTALVRGQATAAAVTASGAPGSAAAAAGGLATAIQWAAATGGPSSPAELPAWASHKV
jgi:hypothetical protein